VRDSSGSTNNSYVPSPVAANQDDQTGKEVAQSLGKKETYYVNVLRVILILLVVGAAVAVAVIVYLYMKDSQETDLNDDFNDLSYRLIDGFHANTKLCFQVLDSFSTQVTTLAMATKQTWPFVTIDNFEAIGTAARSIVDSYYVALYPLVTRENREAWENYTMDNTHWLSESFVYQRDFFDNHNRTVGKKAPDLERRRLSRGLQQEEEQATREPIFDGPDNVTTEIYRYGTEEEGFLFVVDTSPGPYLPIWQVSPSRDMAYIDVNFDIYATFLAHSESYAATFFDTVFESKHGIFGGVWNAGEEGIINEDDDYDFRPVPAAALFYPVFDTIMGGLNRTTVGTLEMDVEFGALFSSVLPANSDKLICVIRYTCGLGLVGIWYSRVVQCSHQQSTRHLSVCCLGHLPLHLLCLYHV
jgi:hypothetical protein